MKLLFISSLLLILSCEKSVVINDLVEIQLYEEDAMVFLSDLSKQLIENGYSTEICLCDTNANQVVDPLEIPHQTWEYNEDEKQYLLIELKLVGMTSFLNSTLPNSISRVTHLKKITINNSGLIELPDSIIYLENLEILDLFNNFIQILPDSIGKLQNLKILNLGKNMLEFFPYTIELVSGLTHLNLNDNQIDSIPSNICDMVTDLQLSLFNNSLCFESSFPECIVDEVLYQTNCYSPNDLSVLDSLVSANLISPEICNCDLNGNGAIEGFELGNQVWQQNNSSAKLLEFTVNNSGLQDIHENTLSQLSGLNLLNLAENSIDSLPDDITDLINLTALDVSENNLYFLPQNMLNMPELKNLNVSYNDSLDILPSLPILDFIDITYTNLFCDSGYYDETLLQELMNEVSVVEGAYFQFCKMKPDIDFIKDFISINGLTEFNWQQAGEQNWIDGRITEFNYSNSQVVDSIPQSIADLTYLTELTFAENNLDFIPDTLSELLQLNRMDFHSNNLTSFEIDLTGMDFLAYLDLSSNELLSIPENICQLGIPEILLGDNRICSCDEEIPSICPVINVDEMLLGQRCADCTEIQFLQELAELNNNDIDDVFSMGIQVWGSTDTSGYDHIIQFIYNYNSVIDNKVFEIPESISNLNYLDTLEMDYHSFSETAGRIFSLVGLSYLELKSDSIEIINEEIGQLTELEYLDLSQNEISDIPYGLASLSNLDVLILRGNNLQYIPDTLMTMVQLSKLDLSNNEITSVSTEISQLQNLQILFLDGNLLESLPSVICDLAIDWENSSMFSVEDNQLCDTLNIPDCIIIEPLTQNCD